MGGSSKLVKLGLIGCGRVAETRHLPALASLPQAQVVAVADIDPERLKTVADTFRIEHRYPDFQNLLSNSTIDAVAICVPAQFHVEVALTALDAGKHLFIEKPLALSLDEADQLIERASRSPVQAMVGFNLRGHRLVQQAREIIRQGMLGTLELIRTALTSDTRYDANAPEWRKRREQGGGALFEIAVHHFDLWRFLLQSEVEEVFATSRSGEWEDQTTTVTARMANGALSSAVISESTGISNELDIYGHTGHLHASLYCFDGLQFSPVSRCPGDARTRLARIIQVAKEIPQAVSAIRQGGVWCASYQTQWRHFIDCIQQTRPVGCTLEDGRRTLQVALAAAKSASLRQPVKVTEAPRTIPPVA